MSRYCENCGQDPREADDPVVCEHNGDWFCSPECMHVACGECYAESQE